MNSSMRAQDVAFSWKHDKVGRCRVLAERRHASLWGKTSAPSQVHRWGCVTYVVDDDVIEVIVPDASGERQGRRELDLYLETWRAHHPGLELELLD